MQKIEIFGFGPITKCSVEVSDFMILTGPQASGKSTLAKSIFFFKNLKNILFEQLGNRYPLTELMEFREKFRIEDREKPALYRMFVNAVRSNFIQVFGLTSPLKDLAILKYQYSEEASISISLSYDYIDVDLSENFRDFLEKLPGIFRWLHSETVEIEESELIIAWRDALLSAKEKIDLFFDDRYEAVYIPAGRSLITVLGNQLAEVYARLSDDQKSSMDYCTKNYIERIMGMKSSLGQGVEQRVFHLEQTTGIKVDEELLEEVSSRIREILQGEYRVVGEDERLQIGEGRYVSINFASSGQQEAVWILNLLFHYLLHRKNACFIIEEPESNLFPNTQKLMTEMIALARNGGQNRMLITTHSPYILGTINNLLYADKIASCVDGQKLEEVVPLRNRLSFRDLSAFFIERGKVISCVDEAEQQICSEVIDGASDRINRDYDEMIALKNGGGTPACF